MRVLKTPQRNRGGGGGGEGVQSKILKSNRSKYFFFKKIMPHS